MTVRTLLLTSCTLSLLAGLPARAQTAPVAAPVPVAASAESPANDAAAEDSQLDDEDIVVVGQRPPGSVIGDIAAEHVLGARDIAATGATSIDELLEAIAPLTGSARGRGDSGPLVLINGKRSSGYAELRDLPPEALQRLDVLPEEVALKYGEPADRRVVNLVLRPRFRSTTLGARQQLATDGGHSSTSADASRLAIKSGRRTSLSLRGESSGRLTEDERDIALDPALASAAIDERPYRTLLGSNRLARANATAARTLFGSVAATANLEAEHREGRTLLGLSAGGAPLGRDRRSDRARLGLALDGQVGRWRWSATGKAEAAGTRTIDDGQATTDERSRSTRSSVGFDLLASGSLLRLPAGPLGATAKLAVDGRSLDSSVFLSGERRSTRLSQSQRSASLNLDLPLAGRGGGLAALGKLGLNANGRLDDFSDSGTLATIGAGANWSPTPALNLIGSWTWEEGAPSPEQRADPIVRTPGQRLFDFTQDREVLVTTITGGNPELRGDRREVVKIGASWRAPVKDVIRLRADLVRSTTLNPQSTFPGHELALEAAFPDRFVRNAAGDLLSVDLRPVNFERARRDTLRLGLDFSKRLQTAPARPDAAEPLGRRFGGRWGQRSGRLTLSLTDSITLADEVTIRPGLAKLDYLGGAGIGGGGGRPRHQLEARAGYFRSGLGARLSAEWRSATRLAGGPGGELRFSPLARFDLRLFANLGEQTSLVARHPLLRDTSLRLEFGNMFGARPRVRDSSGGLPLAYQADFLDPLGRTIEVSIRKLFRPAPAWRSRAAGSPRR